MVTTFNYSKIHQYVLYNVRGSIPEKNMVYQTGHTGNIARLWTLTNIVIIIKESKTL